MQITELRRSKEQGGKTVAEFEAGELLVRLIGTYDSQRSLDELIYVIACHKLAERQV